MKKYGETYKLSQQFEEGEKMNKALLITTTIDREKEPIKNLVRLLNTNFDNTDEKLKITFDKPVKDRQKLID